MKSARNFMYKLISNIHKDSKSDYKIFISKTGVPEIFDSNDNQIKGIQSFHFDYITSDATSFGTNKMTLNHIVEIGNHADVIKTGWDRIQ